MSRKTFAELRQEAYKQGIPGALKLRKADLMQRLNPGDKSLPDLKIGSGVSR